MVELASDTTAAAAGQVAPNDQGRISITDFLNSGQGLHVGDSQQAPGVNPARLHITNPGGQLEHRAPGAEKTNLPPLAITTQTGDAGLSGTIPTSHRPNPSPDAGTAENNGDNTAYKLGREAAVIGGGVGKSFLYGMASLPSRYKEIGESVAIGASLSTLSKAGELGAAATLVVGAYFTSKFLVNTIEDTPRWTKFGAAVADTWKSNEHTLKNLNDVSSTGGNFVFDTSLAYGSGYLGYKNKALADLILQVVKLPLPIPGNVPKFPLTPEIIGATPFLTSVPAPFVHIHHDKDDVDRKDTAHKADEHAGDHH
jgi:hypothetical protein